MRACVARPVRPLVARHARRFTSMQTSEQLNYCKYNSAQTRRSICKSIWLRLVGLEISVIDDDGMTFC